MTENIQIFVRMRPRLENEDQDAWALNNNSIISLPRDPINTRRYADAFYNYSFNFDKMFSNQDNTLNVFQTCCPMIQQVIQGYNSTIFLYGQTTSGKTFTMLGDQTNPGLLPYTLLDIFQNCNKPKTICYLEIYNEQINDLLSPGSTNLKLQDQNGVPFVQNLKYQDVDNFDDALSLLRFGEEQRCYREKQVHEHSSRSHTVFQIFIQQDVYSSVLSLVDLAGSERLQDEESSDETGYINKSLFVLSNVINKLAEGKKAHIPYRDSKLTRYLQNSLGGNSYTTIICTISPASMNFYQTLSTLRFAQRAKKVQNRIQKPEIKQNNVEQLLKEIQELKAERDELLKNKGSGVCSTDENELIYNQAYLFAKDKGQFIQDSQEIIQKYNSQKQILNNQYLSQLWKIAGCESKGINQVFLYKEELSKLIEAESVFNNVYVNSILNPQNQLEFQEDFENQLGKAYKEATEALKQKYQETCQEITLINQIITKNILSQANDQNFNKLTQQVQQEYVWAKQQNMILNEQIGKKLQILEHAYQNVILKASKITDVRTRNSTSTPKFTDRETTQLYVWGSGKDGRLGTGNQQNQSLPFKIQMPNSQYVACGYYHSAVINNENQCFIWGKQQNGITLQPKLILSSIKQVACGWQHTLALTLSGQVYSWGCGDDGQLGHGNFELQNQPKLIEKFNDIYFVSAGHSHSGAINSKQQLYMWGCNSDNRLMIQDENCIESPTYVNLIVKYVSLGYNHTGFILQDGTVCLAGGNQSGQLGRLGNDQLVKLPMKANEIACGEEFTILLSNGNVYSCGKKSNGTLGHQMSQIPACLSEFKQIEALKKIQTIAVGKRHCLAISASKTLYGWGFNFYDQLGIGDKNRFIETPIQILQDVVGVACGEYHSLAIVQ